MESNKREYGTKRSNELCFSYFRTLKVNCPKSWNLYNEIGKGNPEAGYDIVQDLKSVYVSNIRDFYFKIRESSVTFLRVNDKISSRSEEFKNSLTVNNRIWRKIWKTNSFTSYKSYYYLKEANRVLNELEEENFIKTKG